MEVRFDSLPTTLHAHPLVHAAAVGCVDGSLTLLFYAEDDGQLCQTADVVWSKHFKQAVRRVRFHQDGQSVFSITKNRALCQRHVESGRKMRCIRISHKQPPYALLTIDENLLATGDEEGVSHLWDWRCGDAKIARFKECIDYISDFAAVDKLLLQTSGDATLSAIDLRKRRPVAQSDELQSDLLCIALAAGGKRILCGSGSGMLEAFAFNQWEAPVERIKTFHPHSVESLKVVEDTLIITASLDGTVRLTNLHPTKRLGVIASHDEGVEEIDTAYDDCYLLSCGHDQLLKVTPFHIEDYQSLLRQKSSNKSGAKTKETFTGRNFFSDL